MPHEEQREMILREYTVGEFRGDFPQIETDSRVDMEILTAGDDDPFFVTLPVARVGETSGNGLIYDEELVEAIANQVVGQGGIMGHIQDRKSEFPPDAVDWVGAKRVGETLWAKAYVPPGEARSMIRRRKARGGKLATSIYGPFEEREALDNGSWRARGLTLESLDLAPPERAALRVGDGSFKITAEMADETENEGDDEMTKEELIAELTADDVPASLREQIVNGWQEENQHEDRIAELEEQVEDRDTLINELQDRLAEHKVKEFNATLDNHIAELVDWNVDGEEAEGKVDAFRRTLRARILAEMEDDERDPEKVEEIAAEVWDEMKPLAETLRAALSGPAAVVSGKVNGRQLDDSPEARRKARAQFGA